MIVTIDVIVGIIKVKEMLTLESEFNLKSQNDMYELILKSQSWKNIQEMNMPTVQLLISNNVYLYQTLSKFFYRKSGIKDFLYLCFIELVTFVVINKSIHILAKIAH